jgi:hypothetical protein
VGAKDGEDRSEFGISGPYGVATRGKSPAFRSAIILAKVSSEREMVVRETIKIEMRSAARDLLDAAPELEHLKEQGILADERFANQVRDDLLAIANLPINEPVDGLRVRVGSFHIKLKKSLWQTMVTGIVVAIGALDPGHFTKANATVAILQYLAALKTFLSKLDAAEIEVYDAIAELLQEKRADGKIFEVKEVSEPEVAQRLCRHRDSPANLTDILSNLVVKGGLLRKFHGSSQTFYSTVF